MLIAIAAIIGPRNNPIIPNCITPASVDRTVRRVWSRALEGPELVENFLITTGLIKLSIINPIMTPPNRTIINESNTCPWA
jgi:hypothetical protein